MNRQWSSKALEVNLAQTRAAVRIPPEHQRIIDLSASHPGINQRTAAFFQEYHHPYSCLLYTSPSPRD